MLIAFDRMRWFDSTPAGRILNRFSEDFAKVDGSLVDTVLSVYDLSAEMATAVDELPGVALVHCSNHRQSHYRLFTFTLVSGSSCGISFDHLSDL